MLLWDILFRGQLGFSISFLEEMYARNLGNLLISPLRATEFVAALMIMSIIRLAIGMVPVTLLAIWFFGFNLWALGFALAAFFANLMLTGWAVGIFVSGLVLAERARRRDVCLEHHVPVPARSPASITRSQPCHPGCRRSPGRCRRPTYSKGCARW